MELKDKEVFRWESAGDSFWMLVGRSAGENFWMFSSDFRNFSAKKKQDYGGGGIRDFEEKWEVWKSRVGKEWSRET